MYRRVIPCLDIKNGRIVKGIKFVNLKDVGNPAQAAAAYCEAGADELVFLDIAATVEKRKTRIDWVKRVKEVVTVPFCVGGGIGNIEDMQNLFNMGLDKISLNTAAVKNPDLLKEAIAKFGSKRIVVAIDGKKNEKNSGKPRLEVVISGGEEITGMDAVSWAKEVEKLGTSEILLTSKDADGTKQGYDIEINKAVAQAVNIPVIASGGAGSLEHLYEALTEGEADAVLAASIFHYGKYSIKEVKQYLKGKGIKVRL